MVRGLLLPLAGASALLLAGCGAGPTSGTAGSDGSAGPVRSASCPDALHLGADGVARAADQARLEAASLYGTKKAHGVRVIAAYRASSRGGHVTWECGKKTARRTVVVALFFPATAPSASMSQGTVAVSRLPHGYRVWQVIH